MAKLLIVNEIYPSGGTGGTARARYILKVLLKKGHKLDLVCLEIKQIVGHRLSHPNLTIHAIKGKSSQRRVMSILRKFFNLFSTLKPFQVQSIYDPRVREKINYLQKKNTFDHVIFDGFGSIQYLESNQKKAIYIDAEDITDLFRKRSLLAENVFKKCWFFSEYLRMLWYESTFFNRPKEIWAINEENVQKFSQKTSAIVRYIPTVEPLKANVFNPDATNIVFTGLLNWEENVKGLEWFLDNCWQQIKEEFPQVKLNIVGQQSEHLQKSFAQKYQDVIFAGFVKDLTKIYRQSAVAIGPMLINAGIKMKVLNYLSYGLPVVSTKIALKGMLSDDGVLSAHRADDFAKNVIRLLKNKRLRISQSKKARKNIRQNHSSRQFSQFLKSTQL